MNESIFLHTYKNDLVKNFYQNILLFLLFIITAFWDLPYAPETYLTMSPTPRRISLYFGDFRNSCTYKLLTQNALPNIRVRPGSEVSPRIGGDWKLIRYAEFRGKSPQWKYPP